MTTPDSTPRPVPSLREKGYVSDQSSLPTFSQWLEEEQLPELQFPNCLTVYSRMEREDSRVSSLLSAVKLPILRTPWRIEPNGARDEVVEHVSRNIGLPVLGASAEDPLPRTRGRFSWTQHLAWALSNLQYGFSIFEQVYRIDDDGRVWLAKLGPRPQRTVSKFNVALDGGLDSIEQYSPASDGRIVYGIKPLTLPIKRLVVYTRDMEPGQWTGKSLLRPSYKHWLLKDELIRYQAMAIRRNGVGVPIGEAPEHATQDEVDKLAEIAMSYRGGETAGAALPAGAKLELKGVQGNLPDIQQAIDYHDKAIALAGLAHFLNLSGGGSYALASVQADTFVQSVQTFAETVRDTATAHVIEDLVDVNWGPDEPAPRLVFDEIGSRQDATAAALKMLVDAGLLSPDVLVEQTMRQRLGLPARSSDADSPQPPVPPTTAQNRRGPRNPTSAAQATLF
ncbi:phage portal protein family protein [Gordonia soli]|uniref:Portal protein n=1 Tax=Gordonia soli NBRC 108243 TaxID=1223545 RepID=M0QQR4_9ACTN|nr:DUF935 family protein [Gordonia soli]GAC71020.1 hypothetical protein GS4_47_00100 [Gordonia soli NBRC 108243]